MKLIALSAALIMGGGAVAQTAPMQDAPAQNSQNMPAAVEGASTTDPIGGYMPTRPALSGTPTPGQQVIFRANPMTPDQAFPPPQPMAEYPICGPNEFDNCRQRGG